MESLEQKTICGGKISQGVNTVYICDEGYPPLKLKRRQASRSQYYMWYVYRLEKIVKAKIFTKQNNVEVMYKLIWEHKSHKKYEERRVWFGKDTRFKPTKEIIAHAKENNVSICWKYPDTLDEKEAINQKFSKI